jgi:hypothetical protein
MIDRSNRRKLAEALWHLASGQISNDEYENRTEFRSSDLAIREIWRAVWGLYSDLRMHRLTGKDALTPESKEAVARCILFLHSDLSWEWPSTRISLVTLLCNIGTFGVARRRADERYRAAGEFAVWPFFRRADYEAALANPKLLHRAT